MKAACDERGIIRSAAVDTIERMTQEELDEVWAEMKMWCRTKILAEAMQRYQQSLATSTVIIL